jgi:hypothetical protein
MEADCTHCGCPVADHDPVYVAESDGDGGRTPAGAFCTYGCLLAHVEDAELAVGASCSWAGDD